MQISLLLFSSVILICAIVFIFVFLIFRIFYMRQIILSDLTIFRKRKFHAKNNPHDDRLFFNPYQIDTATYFSVYKLCHHKKTDKILDFDPTYFTIFQKVRKTV